jgi:hypothetical protein
MGDKSRQFGALVGAVTLSAGMIAVSLAPLPLVAQTTESTAFEVAKDARSADAALNFIKQYPESPLAVELVEALPDDTARELCAELPENVAQALLDKCSQLLGVLPAAGPTPAAAAAAAAGPQLAGRADHSPGPSY